MKLYLLLFISVFLIAGCSSSSSEFNGSWVLTDYTFDNGTTKFVPERINTGISISSTGVLGVLHGFCQYFEMSYVLDNGVLTTSVPVSSEPTVPIATCTAFYSDVDNEERSELLRRAFFKSQTLIVVSNGLLNVTTTQNETLNFERASK